MNQNFYEAVEDNPIIAAVKSMEDVEECCKHDDIRVIFILFGDVCSIGSIVKTIRDAGKIAMVHMDLISGLKFGCASLSGYIYLHRYAKNPNTALLASLLYAFSAYSIYNIFFNHFHEAITDQKSKRNVYVYSTPCFLTGFNGI